MATETLQPDETVHTRDRIHVGCTPVDPCTFDEAVSLIIEHASKRGDPAFITTPNAQHSILLELSPDYRKVYENSLLCLPDGVSMIVGASLLGHTLPARIPGVDLFLALCAAAAESDLRVFLLGGRPGSAKHAAVRLLERHPRLQIQSHCPSYGFENDDRESANIRTMIREFSPHILFVGLGAPKQEFWMAEHGRKLDVPVCVGVGGTFELTSGAISRAPDVLRRCGLEWTYRLIKEPRRLWRRYLLGNIAFLAIVLNQKLSRIAAHSEATPVGVRPSPSTPKIHSRVSERGTDQV